MGWSTPLFLIDSESSPSFFSSKYVLACVLLSEIFSTSMSTTLNSLTSVFSISELRDLFISQPFLIIHCLMLQIQF